MKYLKSFIAVLGMSVMLLTFPFLTFAEDIDNDIVYEGSNEKIYQSESSLLVYQPDTESAQQPKTESHIQESSQVPSSTQQSTPAMSEKKDYVGDLFGGKVNITTPSNEFAGLIENIANQAISFIVYLIPFLFIFVTVIDIACLLISPVRWVFQNVVPLKLYSDSVDTLTGTNHKTIPTGANGLQKVEGQNIFVTYFMDKTISCLFAFIIIALMVSGVWWSIAGSIANEVMNWLS